MLRTVLILALTVALGVPAFAAEPTVADLQAQLKAQAERIDKLETLLGLKTAPVVVGTPTAVSNFVGYTSTQGTTYTAFGQTAGACANGQCAGGSCSAPQQRGFGLGFHFFRR